MFATGNVELASRLKDWSDRFVRFESTFPGSDVLRLNRVSCLIYEGIALVAEALDAKIPNEEIIASIADARRSQAKSPFVRRLQEWPLGYAGDFETIEYLYKSQNRAIPDTFSWYVEEMTLNTPIAQQHRNKIVYQADLIIDTVLRFPDAKVLVIACGGAPDVCKTLPLLESSRSSLVLNDIDRRALSFCESKLQSINERVNYVEGNALQVSSRIAETGPFDLIVCGGLFDYLSDRQIVILVRKLWRDLLRAGSGSGRLFFTNIVVGNPYRPWMEVFANWRLIERSRIEILHLVREAGIDELNVSIVLDPSRLTWLVEIIK